LIVSDLKLKIHSVINSTKPTETVHKYSY